jgi:abortive infection bacteriophage resistance protein
MVSNYYKSTPTWYVDNNIVSAKTIKFFEKLYYGNNKSFIKNNKPINKHHIKYIGDRYAPAWKALEFFTFGQINKLFIALQDEDLKTQIAGIYGYKDLATFHNHITAIVNIRNICSHNGILFDYNQPLGIFKIPKFEYRILARNQTNLNASLCVIFSILSVVSKNRVDDLKTQLNKLISNNISIPELKQIIEEKIGYQIN